MVPADKLSTILEKLLTRTHNVSTQENQRLDALVVFISEQIEKGNSEISEIIEKWLTSGLNLWSAENYKPCQYVINFTIKLIAIISKHELAFLRCHRQCNIYETVCRMFEYDSGDVPDGQKIEFVKLFLSLLEHNSGRQWLLQKCIIKAVEKFAKQSSNSSVRHESQNFFCKFLLKENENDTFCREIIRSIVEPILSVEIQEDMEEERFNEMLAGDKDNLFINSTELITKILEETIFIDLDNKIPLICISITDFETRVKCLYASASLSSEFFAKFQKLSMLMIFARIRNHVQAIDGCLIEEAEFDEFRVALRAMGIPLITEKGLFHFALHGKLILTYWEKIQLLKRCSCICKPYSVQKELVRTLIHPYFGAINPYYLQRLSFYQKYMEEMSLTTTIYGQRWLTILRSLIINSPEFPIEKLCVTVTNYVLELMDVLTRDTLITICQAIRIVLESYVVKEMHKQKNSCCSSKAKVLFYESVADGDPIEEKPILLASLLNCIFAISTKFKIKWQECAENNWLRDITKHILSRSNLQPDVLMLSLKIFKCTNENYLEAKLSFFEDHGFYLNHLGPVLKNALYDSNATVQNGAFEILNEMAIGSEQKYIFYQKFFLDYDFLDIAVDMLRQEVENSKICCVLLNFLSSTVRIDYLWENRLSRMNLLDVVLPLIQESKDAIVRSKAISLITELFIHNRSLQLKKFEEMMEIMAYISLFDSDWVVKNNAIKFWDQWIKYQLYLQGMIAGEFPEYTFSKKRRIVELTEYEIISRLHDAIDNLAAEGCLGILLTIVQAESNFQLIETASDVLNTLKEILMKYNVPISNEEEANEEEIVVLSDNSIIQSNKNNDLSSSESEELKRENFKNLKKLGRLEFLKQIFDPNFETCIENRKSLLNLNSFDFVLDDLAQPHRNNV